MELYWNDANNDNTNGDSSRKRRLDDTEIELDAVHDTPVNDSATNGTELSPTSVEDCGVGSILHHPLIQVEFKLYAAIECTYSTT